MKKPTKKQEIEVLQHKALFLCLFNVLKVRQLLQKNGIFRVQA